MNLQSQAIAVSTIQQALSNHIAGKLPLTKDGHRKAVFLLEQMTGEQESISWGVFPLMDQDVLYVRSDGGGGYGDPLEREPDKIARDVREGSVSEGVARNVYGVVLDSAEEVDAAASTLAREAIRAGRLGQEAAE